MSEEWADSPLSALARVDRGASWAKTQEVSDGSGTPVVRIANVQPSGLDLTDVRSVVGLKERDIQRSRIADASLLMVGSNGNPERIGNVYQCDDRIEGMVLASFLVGIHATDSHTAKWLFYVLSSANVQASLTEATAGSTGLKNLSIEWLRNLRVPVPPVLVQRRIVDLMTHLDSHLANLRAEREALRDVEIAQRRTFLAPNEDWDSGLLGDLAEVHLGRMLSKERSAGESLAPYIRNANVQWAGLDLRDLKQMDFPAEERVKYALRSGDILVCEGGDPGRAVLLDEDIEGVYYQKAIHRVRPSDSVDSQFLYFWLAEAYADGRINDLCTNTTIKHLTAEKFKTLAVRLPAVDVQKTIAGRLRQLQGHAASIDREIAAAISVRNALLGDLLTQEAVINAEYDLILGVVA